MSVRQRRDLGPSGLEVTLIPALGETVVQARVGLGQNDLVTGVNVGAETHGERMRGTELNEGAGIGETHLGADGFDVVH